MKELEPLDLTPSAMGYAKMLWVIANDSENAEDRQWAKTQLLEGYAQALSLAQQQEEE